MTFYFKIFFYSVLISFSLVLFDSYFQHIIGYNLFGYPKEGILQKNSFIYLTSFFFEEKNLEAILYDFYH